MNRLVACLTIFLSFQFSIHAQEELGKVNWLRDFQLAQSRSAKEQKPILILFQEIPGCATCKKFGNSVMSNVLIKEMIETYFIPVAVYNNLKGKDAEILATYKEPAWNNPVLRIVGADGKDIIPRHSGKYDPGSVVSYLNKGIFLSGNLVPQYARILDEELNSSRDELTLEMYCFWSGEKNIGGQKGILYTEPGYSQGHEVVKVVYNNQQTNAATIIKNAKKSSNADALHTSDKNLIAEASKISVKVKPLENYRIDKDVHYYLKNSPYASIPMTNMQATKVNSALGNNTSPDVYLSPSQLEVLQKVKSGKITGQKRYLQDVNSLLTLK